MGVFTTAGTGPIQKACLAEAEVLDQIWDAIRSLPEVTENELVVTVPSPDDFIEFAKRGLFSLDWTDVYRAKNETSRYANESFVWSLHSRFRDIGPTTSKQLVRHLSKVGVDM